MAPNQHQTAQHVTHVFGNPKNEVSRLIDHSVAVRSLPAHLQEKLVIALRELPEGKQVQALQALQKERGSYMTLAQKGQRAEEKFTSGMAQLKSEYIKKAQHLAEQSDREDADDILS